MKEAEFELIAHRIGDVLDDITNVARHAEIKKELVTLLQKFSVYSCSTY
jgi:glycine hydroxymethyltransferase